MEFGAILQEIQAWKDKGVNWAECGPFPKFGDHNNLLVQKILLWGCDWTDTTEEGMVFERLELDFLFTEGGVPGPFSFWAGSRWTDKGSVDIYTTPIEPTWVVGKYQDQDLNDIWKVPRSLHAAPRCSCSARSSTIKYESTASINNPEEQDSDHSGGEFWSARKRSRYPKSGRNGDPYRPLTSDPCRPRFTLDDWEPAPKSPLGRSLNRALSKNSTRECRQELAALKSQHETETLTLTSKIDALKSNVRTLTSQHKADTLALTSKFDALASILTTKVDKLASNGPKSKSDVPGEDGIAEADKPTMARISALQMQNAKLQSGIQKSLELFAAQERYFHTRFLAIRRDLGRVQDQDKGEIVAVELEELQRIRAGGSNNEDADA